MKLRTPREREVAERLVVNLDQVADQVDELLADRTEPDVMCAAPFAPSMRDLARHVERWLADEPHEVTS